VTQTDGSIQIRTADEEDAHTLWRVRRKAILHGASQYYTPEQIGAWAGRRTPRSYRLPIERARIRVAECADGTVAGFAQLDPETGEVEAVYVHPAWTRRGIGARLLEELQERARTAGLKRLHLDASLNAVRFYERAGYRIEHPILHPLPNGIEIACVFMTKHLL